MPQHTNWAELLINAVTKLFANDVSFLSFYARLDIHKRRQGPCC